MQIVGEREHSDLTDNTVYCYTDCWRKRAQQPARQHNINCTQNQQRIQVGLEAQMKTLLVSLGNVVLLEVTGCHKDCDTQSIIEFTLYPILSFSKLWSFIFFPFIILQNNKKQKTTALLYATLMLHGTLHSIPSTTMD